MAVKHPRAIFQFIGDEPRAASRDAIAVRSPRRSPSAARRQSLICRRRMSRPIAEIAVNAVGNSSEMRNPGVLSQLIAKSGRNSYHGDLYADYENDSMEAHDIDSEQIAKGLIALGR
jgi:hypothetical protein